MELEPGFSLEDLVVDGLALAAEKRYQRGRGAGSRTLSARNLGLLREVYLELARRLTGPDGAIVVCSNAQLVSFSDVTGDPLRLDQIAQAVTNWRSLIQPNGLRAEVPRGQTMYVITFYFTGKGTHWLWFTAERQRAGVTLPLISVARPETTRKVSLLAPLWRKVVVALFIALVSLIAGAAIAYATNDTVRQWIDAHILGRRSVVNRPRVDAHPNPPSGTSLTVQASSYAGWRTVTTTGMNKPLVMSANAGCAADGTLNPITLLTATQESLPLVLLRNGVPISLVTERPESTVPFYRDREITFGRQYTYQLARIDVAGRRLDASIGATFETPPRCVAGNHSPSGTLTAVPSEGEAPLNVTFRVTAVDPDGDPLRYYWTFPNTRFPPQETTSPIIEKTFPGAGTFEAIVQANDGAGAAASMGIVRVHVRGGQTTHIAPSEEAQASGVGSVTPLFVHTGEPVTLVATPTVEPSGARPIGTRWDFGDCDAAPADCYSAPVASFRVQHRYKKPGGYVVRVLVKYDNDDLLLIPFAVVPVLDKNGGMPGYPNWIECCGPRP